MEVALRLKVPASRASVHPSKALPFLQAAPRFLRSSLTLLVSTQRPLLQLEAQPWLQPELRPILQLLPRPQRPPIVTTTRKINTQRAKPNPVIRSQE